MNDNHLIAEANHNAIQRLMNIAELNLNWGAGIDRECFCAFCDTPVNQGQFHFYALDDQAYGIWYCSQVCLAAHRIKS